MSPIVQSMLTAIPSATILVNNMPVEVERFLASIPELEG